MNPLPQNPVVASGSFAAMKSVPYRLQFIAYVLAMMADNIEHVISYWVVFQKFHSPALGGFAVLSHWLPFLLFSVAVGALADRFDPRRIIQCGMLLFIVASAGWGFFFITDTLADVARDAAAGDPWLRRRAVADAEPAAALRHRRSRRSAERGAAECDGALSRHPGRPRRRRRHHAHAGHLARHHLQHAVLPADAAVAVLGAGRATRASRCGASPCAALPISC